MKINLTIAVVAAIQSFISINAPGFSAHDVTLVIRKLVNDKTISLESGSNVRHQEVRNIFETLRYSGILKDVFNLEYDDSRGYFWYKLAKVKKSAAPTPAPTPKSDHSRSMHSVISYIEQYVASTPDGERTAKEIQSALHGRASLSCNQIVRISQSSSKLAVAPSSNVSRSVIMAI